jgi:hypothetical protein
MNKYAQKLGRRGRGKKKTLTAVERDRRRALLARVRKLRWRKRAKL